MKNISEAVTMALEMEKRGYDIYMKAAGKTRNKFGKSTLEAIALKEIDHIKAIEEFSSVLRSKSQSFDKAINLVNIKNKKDYLLPIMEKIRNELGSEVAPDKELEASYRVAMRLETESYDLYKKLASEAALPNVKQFFEFLMGEENTHYELLQDTLEYLTQPGEWFRENERWIVEGG